MKRILLLSDTHGYMDDRIRHYAEKNDEVWHAGDIGAEKVIDALQEVSFFRAVYGNIDDNTIRSALPLDLHFDCEGVQVYITHIAGYPNRYNKRVIHEIKKHAPDLVICGHSHILKVMEDSTLNHLHMNPGAAGKHGFHKVRTMLQFEVSDGKLDNLQVIELGKRGTP